MHAGANGSTVAAHIIQETFTGHIPTQTTTLFVESSEVHAHMKMGEGSEAYERELQAAKSADVRRIRRLGIIRIPRTPTGEPVTDSSGNVPIILIPALIRRESDAWEKAFQTFLLETEDVLERPYRLIYFHSAFSPPAWFAWWIFSQRWRISAEHRANMQGICVVHGSLWVRMFLLGVRGWLGERFWGMLGYADRLAELWLDDWMSEELVEEIIPDSVREYEKGMVEEAEKLREIGVVLGMPRVERERSYNPSGREGR